MKQRPVTYEHRVQPPEPHAVEPTRDPGINNPNRCARCGLAIIRTSERSPEE